METPAVETTVAASSRASWLPRGADHLFLAAAVCPDERGERAWHTLSDSAALEPTAEQVRLLPLVAAARGTDDPSPLLEWGRRVGRQTRARLHWLTAGSAPALAAIADVAGPPMLMKGIPLVLLHCTEPGLRPVHDLDVLVPFTAFPAAVRALGRAGCPVPDHLSRQFPVDDHAVGTRIGEVVIDLHWIVSRALPLEGAARAWGPGFWTAPVRDDEAWARSVPLEFGGVECVAPSPADLLVHVCLHGALVMHSSTPRWAADAALLLRSDHAIDWDVVVAQARRRRVTIELRDAFSYLADDLGQPVPAEVRHALQSARVRPREHLAHAVRTRPGIPARRRVRRFLGRWLVLTTAESAPHALAAGPRLARLLASRSRA